MPIHFATGLVLYRETIPSDLQKVVASNCVWFAESCTFYQIYYFKSRFFSKRKDE